MIYDLTCLSLSVTESAMVCLHVGVDLIWEGEGSGKR
jgi:hypothetical protein